MKTHLAAIAVLMLSTWRLPAAETLRLENDRGAGVTLAGDSGGWRVVALQLPGVGERAIEDRSVEVVVQASAVLLAPEWTLEESDATRAVLRQDAAGLQLRRQLYFGASGNVLRIETWARSIAGSVVLARLGLLDWRVEEEWFRETGAAPASFPLFGENLFAGIEHVSGESHTTGDTVQLTHRPRMAIGEEWQLVATAVVGWPLPGAEVGLPEGARMRIAFLHYLDRVRVVPDRIILHSETWWTMMPPLSEKDILADIEALQRGFHQRTGMFFDTYCLDLGWSDPKTFWQIAEARFPNGFRTIQDRLAGLGAKLGLWMSPGSGYPEGLSNSWLQAQGYEMMPFSAPLGQVPCFALGTRHQREFKERIVSYARQHGLGHVILDFMPLRCDVATHGHPVGPESRYAIDAGVADVLDALRAVNPQIALEPMVCGYPPSPWWLMKTPFILGPAGDDVPYGRVASPEWLEALISARDIAYRASQESWLMPTQALETWDIVYQTPGDFKNTAVMAVGRGRWFLSNYLKPSLMKPEDWDFLAAMVRWARANKALLTNAWMIGGKPEDREAYGYMFRQGAKDIFCVRNPWIEERTIELPASPLAAGPRELRMIYPRRVTLARLEPGSPAQVIRVPAYETALLETVPAAELSVVEPENVVSAAIVQAAAPTFSPTDPQPGRLAGTETAYSWFGRITTGEMESVELCVLVQGGPEVAQSTGDVFVNGRAAKVQRSGSAGQFGAATEASPEHWTWYIASVPRGEMRFEIALQIPEEASVGVYLRGTVAATSDPMPEDEISFPVFRATVRPWSQTLQPLRRREGD